MADMMTDLGSAHINQAPEQVGIEITNRCDLACRHCFNHSGEGELEELSRRDLQELFGQLSGMGVTRVRLSGGEPTRHPDFTQIILDAQKCGLGVTINTHGIFSDARCEAFAQLPVEQWILSLDGLQAANDQIRGKGMFDRAVANATRLKQLGQAVQLGVHLCRLNKSDVPGLINLASDLGVDIKFSPLRPIGRAVSEMADQFLMPVEFYRCVQTITRLRASLSHIRITTDFDILQPVDPSTHPTLKPPTCPAGRSMLNVNYDGFVYPCAFLVTLDRAFAAGRVQDASLSSLWRGAPVFQLFRALVKEDACQKCFAYRQTCTGGCLAVSYVLTGRLEPRDPTCFIHELNRSV